MEKSSNIPFQKRHGGLQKPGLLTYFIKILLENFSFFFFSPPSPFSYGGGKISSLEEKFSICFNVPQHLSPFFTGSI